jgi:cation transport ATPase
VQKKCEEMLIKNEKEKYTQQLEMRDSQHSKELQDMRNAMKREEEIHRKEMKDEVEKHSEYIRRRDEDEKLRERKRRDNIRKKADQEAQQAREKWYRNRRVFIGIATWILVLAGIGGVIVSVTRSDSFWISLLLVVYLITSSVSVYDTIFAKQSKINNWLLKRSYQYETRVREKKVKEYSDILQSEEIAEECDSQLVGV